MLKLFKEASALQIGVWTVLLIGTVVSIVPPDVFVFKVVSKFVVQIMLAYLGLGLLFLLFSDEKSMLVSFACCGVLCLFLRTRSAFFAPPQNAPTVSVANFNLSLASDEYYDTTINVILANDADVVSIQEVTPDWDLYLRGHAALREKYPYDTTIVRLDFHGVALYSKFPFTRVDTFHYKDIPNLAGCIHHDSLNQDIYFISSHTVPPISLSAYDDINKHLLRISEFVATINKPLLTLGDYQVMPWSNEIVRFRQRASLNDSRRDMPASYFPYDHIFYSDELDCINFRSIGNNVTDHIGILGEYQLRTVQ